jgi:hypothetical protein
VRQDELLLQVGLALMRQVFRLLSSRNYIPLRDQCVHKTACGVQLPVTGHGAERLSEA